MFRLFKHYIPYAVLLIAALDLAVLLGSAEAAWVIRARQIGMAVAPLSTRWPPAVFFALSVQLSMIAVGVYGPDALRSRLFEGVTNVYHYVEARAIVDMVPESTLRMSPQQVQAAYPGRWQELVGA